MKTRVLFIVLLISFNLNGMNDDKSTQPQKKTTKIETVQQEFEIPSSLKKEHEELHNKLTKYTKMTGKTGAAAKALAKVLHPHFEKEEEFALPPLGLLEEIAAGNITKEMTAVVPMSQQLKDEWKQMLEEHKQIVVAVDKLQKAAKLEKRTEVVHFTESLKLHAKTEEQVLYPAAIMVGEFVKMKG